MENFLSQAVWTDTVHNKWSSGWTVIDNHWNEITTVYWEGGQCWPIIFHTYWLKPSKMALRPVEFFFKYWSKDWCRHLDGSTRVWRDLKYSHSEVQILGKTKWNITRPTRRTGRNSWNEMQPRNEYQLELRGITNLQNETDLSLSKTNFTETNIKKNEAFYG